MTDHPDYGLASVISTASFDGGLKMKKEVGGGRTSSAPGPSRRQFLQYAVASSAASSVLPALATPRHPSGRLASALSYPVVETSRGKIRGLRQDGVAAFQGVPYGATTGGTNRFLPPMPPTSWAGIRDALRLGNQCPQANSWVPPGWVDTSPQSEDCLVLNVYSPDSANASSKLPVMVWLHGGGYVLVRRVHRSTTVTILRKPGMWSSSE